MLGGLGIAERNSGTFGRQAESGEEALKKARELSQKVHHHLREEEKKFFQVSGRILTAAKKTQLARQYRRDHARMRRELEA